MMTRPRRQGGRCRFVLPTGARSRAAAAVGIGLAWPVGCVAMTWQLLRWTGVTSVSAHLFAGATMLTLLSALTLVDGLRDRVRAFGTWMAELGSVARGLILFVVLAAAARLPLRVVATTFAFATFSAALAEEVVFRRWLPRWLASSLRRARAGPAQAWLAASAVAQLSFAAAHCLNRDLISTTGRQEFVRLFIIGLLYHGVAGLYGLWVAAGLHAALNLTLAASVAAPGTWLAARPAMAVAGAVVSGVAWTYARDRCALRPFQRSSVFPRGARRSSRGPSPSRG